MSKKVATFVRVGNTENAETALKCQEMSVQEYCEKNGYDVVDSAQVIGDRKLGQSMLLKLLDRAEEKDFCTVVMYSSNPVARSISEMQESQQAMDKVGVSFETVDGSHLCVSSMEAFAAAVEAIQAEADDMFDDTEDCDS